MIDWLKLERQPPKIEATINNFVWSVTENGNLILTGTQDEADVAIRQRLRPGDTWTLIVPKSRTRATCKVRSDEERARGDKVCVKFEQMEQHHG